MKRLNIFVDETGEFGFGINSSSLYGISFTFHEQQHDITSELKKLNEILESIGYTGMIHMADLIMKRNDYAKFNIRARKQIFNSIYQFSRRIKVKYKTIIIEKKYTNSKKTLQQQIAYQINKMINENETYFKKFDTIVMYYDNGQETLGLILDSIFSRFDNFDHKVNFDHKEKRLFQVSDMLTFIDKYDYKYNNKMEISKGEKFFFTNDEIKKILKGLSKKRL